MKKEFKCSNIVFGNKTLTLFFFFVFIDAEKSFSYLKRQCSFKLYDGDSTL